MLVIARKEKVKKLFFLGKEKFYSWEGRDMLHSFSLIHNMGMLHCAQINLRL